MSASVETKKCPNCGFKSNDLKSCTACGHTMSAGGPGSGRHPVEGYGVKGMKNDRWRRQFKTSDHMNKWTEKNQADVHGMRFLKNYEIPHDWKSKGYSEAPEGAEGSK